MEIFVDEPDQTKEAETYVIDMKSIDEEFRVPEANLNQAMSHQWKYLQIKRLNLEFN